MASGAYRTRQTWRTVSAKCVLDVTGNETASAAYATKRCLIYTWDAAYVYVCHICGVCTTALLELVVCVVCMQWTSIYVIERFTCTAYSCVWFIYASVSKRRMGGGSEWRKAQLINLQSLSRTLMSREFYSRHALLTLLFHFLRVSHNFHHTILFHNFRPHHPFHRN